MDCRGRLAEFILHIANLIYFLAGITILTFGAIALADPSLIVEIFSYIDKIHELSLVIHMEGITMNPAIYLTVIGSVVIIMTFVGSCGAFKGQSVVTIVYALITLLMMLFNIAIIIYYAVDPYFMQDHVQKNMKTSLTENFEPVTVNGDNMKLPTNESAKAWVEMQFKEACCGAYGPEDFTDFDWHDDNWSPPTDVDPYHYPPSCCMTTKQHTVANNSNADLTDVEICMETKDYKTHINTRGCYIYVMSELTKYNFFLVCTAAGLTALQAIITGFSFYLITVQMKKRKGSIV